MGFRQNKRINSSFSEWEYFEEWEEVARINRRNNKQRWMWRGINLPVGQERCGFIAQACRATLVNSILDRCNRRKTGGFYQRSNISARSRCLHAFPVPILVPRRPPPSWRCSYAFTRLKTSHVCPVVVFVVPVILPVERTMANMESSLLRLSARRMCICSP